MKKIFLILTVFLFLTYSCKSGPDTTDDLQEVEITDTEEHVVLDEELLDEELLGDIVNIEDVEPEEEIQVAEEVETEEETELFIEEIEITEQERSQEESVIDETQLVEEPASPPVEQAPAQPVAQTPPTAPPVVQAPVPVQPTTPVAPVVETVEETQQEEELEPIPPAQPQRDWPPPVAPLREAPPTPMQSVIAPREGDLVLPKESDIVFSRVVRATVGQIIEIPFRGTGWVYLGELASRRGIVYDSRRLDTTGQTFIFRAEEAGTYALKFFRQDFIRDYILNDHVQVIVGDAPAASTGWFGPPVDRGRVVAQPRWPTPVEEAQILRSGSPSGSLGETSQDPSRETGEAPAREAAASGGIASAPSAEERGASTFQAQPSVPAQTPPATGISQLLSSPETREPSAAVSQLQGAPSQEAASIPQERGELIPADQLIRGAKEAFESGNAAAAIALLDQYASRFSSGTDELYWLYGQIYEANTPSRNIKLSLEYYRKLTNEFPQSRRFNDARRRIAYLERFYVNIQ